MRLTSDLSAGPAALYVRWQAVTPNRHGRYPGFFALANGLAKGGMLNDEDFAWWRSSNDWYNNNHTDPAQTDPGVYDAVKNPDAVAFFKTSAVHLLKRVPGYLDLLDRHGVGYECIRTNSPGRIIYEDAEQIIAVGNS